MSSSNTATRFPDLSQSRPNEAGEAFPEAHLMDFSDLRKAPGIIVKQPKLPELDCFSTPQEVMLHIQTVGKQIWQLFEALSDDERPPKEKIDYINKKILTQKPIVDDLTERLSIAREIHGQIDSTLVDTLEMLELNFEDDED